MSFCSISAPASFASGEKESITVIVILSAVFLIRIEVPRTHALTSAVLMVKNELS